MKTMNEQTRRINLTVPTGWNQCSAEQLETVAAIILRRTAMQDRYHPYDPLQMKTEAFFALAGLEVMEQREESDARTSFAESRQNSTRERQVVGTGDTVGTDPSVSVKDDTGGLSPAVSLAHQGETAGEAVFIVRRRAHHRWGQSPFRRLRHHTGDSPHSDASEPFPIAVWQVHSFIDQHLGWLDEFTGLQLFPYHDLGHYWTIDRRWPFAHRHRLGFDGELLDGMTWQQYRFAQEWLSYYVDVNGQLAQMATHRGQSPRNSSATAHTGDSLHESLAAEALRARTEFLRAVYRLPDGHSPRALRRMSPARFQVILIWWQSMMREMQQKYRRCFTKGKNGQSSMVNGQSSLPIDLYTRSTATLQDKYHLTEEQINLQPCRVILQHLEDMAHEAEELERIQRQNKSHKH